MTTFIFKFDELPDFWEGDFRSGAHNGEADIHINADGTWLVKAIRLECSNGQIGPMADSKMIEVSRAYQGAMFDALCDSLEHFSGPHIDDAIDAMKAEAA